MDTTDQGLGAPISAQPIETATSSIIAEPIAAQPTGAQPSTGIQVPAGPVAATGTLALVAGYLNIGVGIVLVVLLGMYVAGFMLWLTHLGLPHRDEGIKWMERAVSTLFWLVVVLAAVRFAQFYPQVVILLVALAVIGLGVWAAVSIARSSGEGEDEH